MNKTELIQATAESSGLSKAKAEAAVTAVFETIQDAMAAGDQVRLTGFGSFYVKKRAERMAYNPVTMVKIVVPVTMIPTFKAGQKLKDALN